MKKPKSRAKQMILLLRGAPAAGKTTISYLIRDKKPKIISINYDEIQQFIARSPREQKDLAFEAVINLAKFFLDRNFSLVIEELFVHKWEIDIFFNLGKKYKIPVFLFELDAPLNILIQRNPDRKRPVTGEIKNMRRLVRLIRENPDPRAIKIDASASPEKCAKEILSQLSL